MITNFNYFILWTDHSCWRYKHCMRGIFFFLLLVFMPRASTAEVIENLDYQYYDVRIAPSQSLLSALNLASPIISSGEEHHGYARWDVSWNYRWSSKKTGACKITSSTTTVRGAILLPRVVNADEAQKSQFDRYVSALQEHEQGHYQIGRDAAKAIDARILSLPEANDCIVLKKYANSVAYQTLEKYKEKNVEYDVKTMHGTTQGAWLSN